MNEAKIKLKRMEAAAPMMFSLLVGFHEWIRGADFTLYDESEHATMNWLDQQTETLIDMVNWGFEEDESVGKEQEAKND